MPGAGPIRPILVVVGEAPATVEDTWCSVCWRPSMRSCHTRKHPIGVPFTGPSGQLLRHALKEAGFDEQQVRFTNITRCSAGGAVNPTMLQMRKCSGYLTEELQSLDYSQCKGVVLLGQSAVRGVLDRGTLSIRAARGRVLDAFGPSLPVALRATFHPAAALPGRNPSLYAEIVKDLREMWRIRDAIRPVEWVTTPAVLGTPKAVGIDLEWVPSTGKIRMVGLATDRQTVIVRNPKQVLRWITSRDNEGRP